MSRTQGRQDSDTGFVDGQISISGLAFQNVNAAASVTYTKIAFGEYSYHAAASAAANIAAGTFPALLRTGVQDWLQEYFGSNRANVGGAGAQGLGLGQAFTMSTGNISAGSLVTVTVNSTVNFLAGTWVLVDTVASGVQEYCFVSSITSATQLVLLKVVNSHTAPFPLSANAFTTPAGVSGPPPFTGVTQLTSVTTARPKGMFVRNLTLSYLVGTAAISAQTVGLAVVNYAETTAANITTLIANATNGLLTAFQATPHAVTIPVPVANQVYITNPNSVIGVEFDFTTGTSGTVDILAATLGVTYNYN